MVFISLALFSCSFGNSNPKPIATVDQSTVATFVSPTQTAVVLLTPVATLSPTATIIDTPLPLSTPVILTESSTSTANQIFLCDALNQFKLYYPEGWSASVPSADARIGMTVITNNNPIAGNDMAEAGQIKIQIGSADIVPGTFNTWVYEQLEIVVNDTPGSNPHLHTEPSPYELGKYNGFTYTVEDRQPIMIVSLLANEEHVIQVGIAPANSPHLDEALSILATLIVDKCEE